VQLQRKFTYLHFCLQSFSSRHPPRIHSSAPPRIPARAHRVRTSRQSVFARKISYPSASSSSVTARARARARSRPTSSPSARALVLYTHRRRLLKRLHRLPERLPEFRKLARSEEHRRDAADDDDLGQPQPEKSSSHARVAAFPSPTRAFRHVKSPSTVRRARSSVAARSERLRPTHRRRRRHHRHHLKCDSTPPLVAFLGDRIARFPVRRPRACASRVDECSLARARARRRRRRDSESAINTRAPGTPIDES